MSSSPRLTDDASFMPRTTRTRHCAYGFDIHPGFELDPPESQRDPLRAWKTRITPSHTTLDWLTWTAIAVIGLWIVCQFIG